MVQKHNVLISNRVIRKRDKNIPNFVFHSEVNARSANGERAVSGKIWYGAKSRDDAVYQLGQRSKFDVHFTIYLPKNRPIRLNYRVLVFTVDDNV